MILYPQILGKSVSLHREVHDALYFEYNFNLTFILQYRYKFARLGLKIINILRYYYLQTKIEQLIVVMLVMTKQNLFKIKEEIMYNTIDNGD